MRTVLILSFVLLAATAADACSVYRASNWPLRGFTYINDCGRCSVYRTEETNVVRCPERTRHRR